MGAVNLKEVVDQPGRVIDGGAPTLGQVNGFNQTSVFCRIYQDKAGKPHAIYAAMLVKSDTRDSAMVAPTAEASPAGSGGACGLEAW